MADDIERDYKWQLAIEAIDGSHIQATSPADGKPIICAGKGIYPSVVRRPIVDDHF